jgi:predicted Zn-ribbon and HTH transcriptional regulator
VTGRWGRPTRWATAAAAPAAAAAAWLFVLASFALPHDLLIRASPHRAYFVGWDRGWVRAWTQEMSFTPPNAGDGWDVQLRQPRVVRFQADRTNPRSFTQQASFDWQFSPPSRYGLRWGERRLNWGRHNVRVSSSSWLGVQSAPSTAPSSCQYETRVRTVQSLAAYPAVLASLPLVALSWRRHRARSRIRSGRCAACGYDLRGTPARCPECGAVPSKLPHNPPMQRTATASSGAVE